MRYLLMALGLAASVSVAGCETRRCIDYDTKTKTTYNSKKKKTETKTYQVCDEYEGEEDN